MKLKVTAWLVSCGFMWVAQGCASNTSRPLDSAMFVVPGAGQALAGAVEPDPVAVTDQPVPSALDQAPKHATILPGASVHTMDAIKPLAALQTEAATMPVAMDAAQTSAAIIEPAAPADTNEHTGQGVYMTLGGVIAQVNDTPIYANQVLSPLKREFTAKSHEMDSSAFREFAEREIGRQLKELIEDELAFATAYHALTDEDRKLAQAVAMQIRAEKVTAAGGSVERAKRLSQEDGEEFDEAVKQEYRRLVYKLYQRRRIDPLIQVNADDMREFYRLSVGKLYSEKDRAQFRVISIDPAKHGGIAAARDKIASIRARAVGGEDFAKLASSQCDDSFLKTRGGNPCDEGGWMEKNTYRFDAVEAAVWAIQPGEVTPVIETENKLFIAKLQAKQNGITRPFEDQQVQDDIFGRLTQQQRGELWRKSKDDSINEAMITDGPEIERRLQVAVDMAMQCYAR